MAHTIRLITNAIETRMARNPLVSSSMVKPLLCFVWPRRVGAPLQKTGGVADELIRYASDRRHMRVVAVLLRIEFIGVSYGRAICLILTVIEPVLERDKVAQVALG